jgi:catechol 2,3-dioxygenase-like lactoylglutathione lyase family enzyme
MGWPLMKSISGGYMRGAMLFAAGLFAGLAIQVMTAQNTNGGVVMMNHVGISVPNMAEAVTYYTQKMGYREAFRVNDAKGQPRLVYMQISKNTFLELNPVTADRPAGFSHYGLHVENAAQAVARFRKNGLTVTDTSASDTKAILANITDPYMGRIELTELPPESMHYKAVQNWK